MLPNGATCASQTSGQWFQIDMGASQSFSGMTLNSAGSTNDYPRGYQVFVSNDGSNWGTAIASGQGTNALLNIQFARQNARYIKIVQTGSTGWWWSIAELNVIQ